MNLLFGAISLFMIIFTHQSLRENVFDHCIFVFIDLNSHQKLSYVLLRISLLQYQILGLQNTWEERCVVMGSLWLLTNAF
jgi:hypothetical protein